MITAFYLEGCPYCRQARKALEELKAEDARYGDVALEWIEENRQPDVAERYDYYHVPAMFLDGEKLYEAETGETPRTCRENVKRVLDAALAKN